MGSNNMKQEQASQILKLGELVREGLLKVVFYNETNNTLYNSLGELQENGSIDVKDIRIFYELQQIEE